MFFAKNYFMQVLRFMKVVHLKIQDRNTRQAAKEAFEEKVQKIRPELEPTVTQASCEIETMFDLTLKPKLHEGVNQASNMAVESIDKYARPYNKTEKEKGGLHPR